MEEKNVYEGLTISPLSNLLLHPDTTKEETYPTGFKKLDEMLGGGYKPGLHFLAGFANSGKSAMAFQMALQMSERDIPVLYFSLELADKECTSRMLSLISRKTMGENAYTAYDFLNPEMFDGDKKADYEQIVAETEKASKNIYLMASPLTSLNANMVAKVIDDFIEMHGKRPMVIIDCLHMLRVQNDEYLSEQQRVEINLHRLKAITDEYNVPILCTTWISRSEYDRAITLKSLKQSNYVALYANTILGLQLEGSGTKWFDFIEATGRRPRKMELVILKNKNAMVGQIIEYSFDLKYNYIIEGDKKST